MKKNKKNKNVPFHTTTILREQLIRSVYITKMKMFRGGKYENIQFISLIGLQLMYWFDKN